MSILFKLLYILVSFIETIIIFRIVMSLIGATPFEGITVKEIYLNKFKIEITPIISLIFFSIIGFILSELSKSLKRTD